MSGTSHANDDALTVDPGPSLRIVALGERAGAARDSEINLIGFLSPVTHQQVLLRDNPASTGWQTTPAAVNGVEFPDSLLSRRGTLVVPRLQGGFLAAVSHPWSGLLEIDTDRGQVRVDLFHETPRAVLIDISDGKLRDFDPQEILRLRSTLVDAMTDASLADQRESGPARDLPLGSAVTSTPVPAGRASDQGLGWVVVRAVGEKSADSFDEQVCVLELEPIAGLFAELSRFHVDTDWSLKAIRQLADDQLAFISRRGQLKLRAAPSGSIAFLSWPDGGIVELDIFGVVRRLDLYSAEPRLLRVQFDEAQRLPDAPPDDTRALATMLERRDFYVAMVKRLDPSKPVGLYVPRWKGVAASTTNLLAQTLPFPHTADGHPADVTPEDTKFLANMLLSSGCRHFVVSGGDLFWIDVIRRVQREEPRVRFDLLWHSNYLQMGEAHDWNLLKNWLRAVSDGEVTRVAVVKSGLEVLFGRLGIDAVFIPNVINADPQAIVYGGAHRDVGIWLSGSSSYRKVPYATLLALKALPEARLIGAGFDDDSLAMVTDMRIPRGEIWRQPLPQEALYRNIRTTGLTFYVTLSECSPMLPLESLHLGVPCLVGANSHLFRSSPYLHRMLVVQSPLSAESIAGHAKGALAEGRAIIDAFQEYSFLEQKQAAEALEQFLA